jgi:putative glutamine amidotransferase
MKYRPKIGIPMRLELETRRFYLARDYSEALEAFGASPVHISLIPKVDYIADVVKGLDGVLLPGSDSDIDPTFYREDPHPKLGSVVPEKDKTDLLILEEAERRNLPILAICFGLQSLNISRGGSLIQDIESQVERPIKHQQGVPRDRNSHKITIEDGSYLHKTLNVGSLTANVNSHHHQSICNVGNDLKATAWAGDQVIEAVEDVRPERFVIGVQWHPELTWKTDELNEKIFSAFVEKCRNRSNLVYD